MSSGTSGVPADWQGYQEWNTDENAGLNKLLNNTEMAESAPLAFCMAIMGYLMNYEVGLVGWTAQEISTASEILTPLSNLQGLFSDPSAYTDEQAGQIINAADEEYQQLSQITDPDNPFYNVAQTVTTSLIAIMPPDWTFPTGSNLTQSDVESVTKWFKDAWSTADTGNTSMLTALNTAFSNGESAVNGESSEAQSQNKFVQSMLQEVEGFFHDITETITGVESQSNSNTMNQ